MFQTFQTGFGERIMAEISDETYEQLRQILETQNGRLYTFEETKEIGDGLMEFMAILASFNGHSGLFL